MLHDTGKFSTIRYKVTLGFPGVSNQVYNQEYNVFNRNRTLLINRFYISYKFGTIVEFEIPF